MWFNHVLDYSAETHQIFACFFGKFKTSKSHSEIKWPLLFAVLAKLFVAEISFKFKNHFEIREKKIYLKMVDIGI